MIQFGSLPHESPVFSEIAQRPSPRLQGRPSEGSRLRDQQNRPPL